jgi:hypothetical protein
VAAALFAAVLGLWVTQALDARVPAATAAAGAQADDEDD